MEQTPRRDSMAPQYSNKPVFPVPVDYQGVFINTQLNDNQRTQLIETTLPIRTEHTISETRKTMHDGSDDQTKRIAEYLSAINSMSQSRLELAEAARIWGAQAQERLADPEMSLPSSDRRLSISEQVTHQSETVRCMEESVRLGSMVLDSMKRSTEMQALMMKDIVARQEAQVQMLKSMVEALLSEEQSGGASRS